LSLSSGGMIFTWKTLKMLSKNPKFLQTCSAKCQDTKLIHEHQWNFYTQTMNSLRKKSGKKHSE
jgi:hypothetical protein